MTIIVLISTSWRPEGRLPATTERYADDDHAVIAARLTALAAEARAASAWSLDGSRAIGRSGRGPSGWHAWYDPAGERHVAADLFASVDYA